MGSILQPLRWSPPLTPLRAWDDGPRRVLGLLLFFRSNFTPQTARIVLSFLLFPRPPIRCGRLCLLCWQGLAYRLHACALATK